MVRLKDKFYDCGRTRSIKTTQKGTKLQYNVFIWENLNTLLFLKTLTILATFEAGCLIYLLRLLWYVFLTRGELYILQVMI